jgi:tryptophan-rich sensory protein
MPFWLKVVLCILGVELLGSVSGLLTASSIRDWYGGLVRPPGNPPNWIFGPVWTLLYAMMGGALALVWHRVESSPARRSALVWFAIQFVLNLAWTPVFFGAHHIAAALLVITALLIAIGVTIYHFRRVHRVAAALLVPYLGWVGYATYLNAGYLVLNGGLP